MKLEEINEIVSNYYKLVVLAKEKIKIIEEFDSQYCTARGIEEISFESDYVNVKCDNSCRGCYDTLYFSFPISFLTKNEDELKNIVIYDKELRLEKERKAKEESKLKEKQDAEQRDLEQYKRLKEKFEK